MSIILYKSKIKIKIDKINKLLGLRYKIINKLHLKIINNKNIININLVSLNQNIILTRFINKTIATANCYRFYSSSSSDSIKANSDSVPAYPVLMKRLIL
jgi:hypothetical protein